MPARRLIAIVSTLICTSTFLSGEAEAQDCPLGLVPGDSAIQSVAGTIFLHTDSASTGINHLSVSTSINRLGSMRVGTYTFLSTGVQARGLGYPLTAMQPVPNRSPSDSTYHLIPSTSLTLFATETERIPGVRMTTSFRSSACVAAR